MDDSGIPARRRRFSPPLRVELVGDGKRGPRYLGYASDLSSSGAFVQCSSPRPQGSRLKVKIHPRRANRRPVYAEVEVAWSRGYTGERGCPPGMGVTFLGLRRREERLLSRWLCSNEEDV